jgi:hypothetical protein
MPRRADSLDQLRRVAANRLGRTLARRRRRAQKLNNAADAVDIVAAFRVICVVLALLDGSQLAMRANNVALLLLGGQTVVCRLDDGDGGAEAAEHNVGVCDSRRGYTRLSDAGDGGAMAAAASGRLGFCGAAALPWRRALRWRRA